MRCREEGGKGEKEERRGSATLGTIRPDSDVVTAAWWSTHSVSAFSAHISWSTRARAGLPARCYRATALRWWGRAGPPGSGSAAAAGSTGTPCRSAGRGSCKGSMHQRQDKTQRRHTMVRGAPHGLASALLACNEPQRARPITNPTDRQTDRQTQIHKWRRTP